MRTGRWLALGVTVLSAVTGVALYGGYRLVTAYWDFGSASAELPAAVEAYRAQGLPFVAADIAPPRLNPAHNAAPAIRAALRLLPPKAIDAALEREARNPGPAADALVARYARPLALVAAASRRTGADFVRDWDLGPNVEFPEYPGLKSLGRAASLRAVREAARGDDAAALRDLDLVRRLALWAGSEPTLISIFARIGMESVAVAACERCLAEAKGEPARIARYASWLQTAPPAPKPAVGLRGEAWMAVAAARNLDRIRRDDDGKTHLDRRGLRRDGLPEDDRQRAFMARILQAWTEASVETRRLGAPPVELGRRFDAIEERWYRKKGLSRMLVMTLFPTFGGTAKGFQAFEARKAVAAGLAEALEVQADRKSVV